MCGSHFTMTNEPQILGRTTKRVFMVERSPLARNVYSMLLKKLYDVEVSLGDSSQSITDLEDSLAKSDLFITSQNSIIDRRDDLLKVVKSLSKKGGTNSLLLVHFGTKDQWEDFEKVAGVWILERPFFPDDFMSVVGEIWRGR